MACTVREPGKCHNPLPVKWGSKKSGSTTSSQSKHPRTRSADVFGAGEDEAMTANSSFLCLFILFRSSTDWMITTHTDESNFLDFVYWSKCYPFMKKSHGYTQEQCFTSYLSGHRWAQWNSHKTLSTTSVNKAHSLFTWKQFHFFSHSHCIDLYDV